MSEIPAPPPVDDKDWTWVLREPCPDCGYDAPTIGGPDVAALVRSTIPAYLEALTNPHASRRPDPEVWSVLEYSCHVRDVCRIFDGRLNLMLTEDDPLFANWDQDATALEERYWEQSPSVIAGELQHDGDVVADRFAAVRAQEWSRTGRRSNGSVFTVETLGQYFAHDLVHHAWDIS